MEPPRQKFNRLLGALDDLVRQEAVTLANRDFQSIGEIHRRAAPLVTGLVELGESAADAVARAKVAALLAQRQHTLDFLETQLATARDELAAVQESVQRVSRIAPAYGRSSGRRTARTLRAAG